MPIAQRAPSMALQAWRAHWIGICATALILASETKFVLKDQVSGAGSNVDIYILSRSRSMPWSAPSWSCAREGSPRLSRRRPTRTAALAYVGYMAVTVPFAPSPVYSAIRVLEMLVLLLLIRAAVIEGTAPWFLSFVKVFLLATAGLILIGLSLPSHRGPLQLERFNWLATHPVIVGQFLALALVASLVLAAGQRWRSPRRALADAALGPGAALFSGGAARQQHPRVGAAAAAAGAAVGLVLVLPQADPDLCGTDRRLRERRDGPDQQHRHGRLAHAWRGCGQTRDLERPTSHSGSSPGAQ